MPATRSCSRKTGARSTVGRRPHRERLERAGVERELIETRSPGSTARASGPRPSRSCVADSSRRRTIASGNGPSDSHQAGLRERGRLRRDPRARASRPETRDRGQSSGRLARGLDRMVLGGAAGNAGREADLFETLAVAERLAGYLAFVSWRTSLFAPSRAKLSKRTGACGSRLRSTLPRAASVPRWSCAVASALTPQASRRAIMCQAATDASEREQRDTARDERLFRINALWRTRRRDTHRCGHQPHHHARRT